MARKPPSTPPTARDSRPVLVAIGLALLALALYYPALRYEFVNYDDNRYVTDNATVQRGVTAANLAWSLTAYVNSNWHPITLISHMLDVQLFGLNSAGHHGSSIVLHMLNTVLLFLALRAVSGERWCSACVAALFAAHPLNIQSVVWISERKNLLSTLFWMLAIIAHVRSRQRESAARSALVLLLLALALASKPMAVTLPLTLILIDYWIDGRWIVRWKMLAAQAVMVAAGIALTLDAQADAHAISSLAAFSWLDRLTGAIVGYAWYPFKLFWPLELAIFYPHPKGSISLAVVLVSLTGLVAVSIVVWRHRQQRRWALFGWLWYLVTLFPVSGVVQVGAQAYADRYAYIPLIGLFVILVWWLPPRFRLAISGVAVVLLSIALRSELPYWNNSLTLFERASSVVSGNWLAHNNLGMALVANNQMPQAEEQFRLAVEAAPWDKGARSNWGNALRALGRPAEAEPQYRAALELDPDDATAHYNLATALIDLGKLDEAATHLRRAIELQADYLPARRSLVGLLLRQGARQEALVQLEQLARLDPNDQRVRDTIERLRRE